MASHIKTRNCNSWMFPFAEMLWKCNQIYNPDDTKQSPRITNCKTSSYNTTSFDALFYVSIMALFCVNLTLLFPLIQPPIFTIQWYYEENMDIQKKRNQRLVGWLV